MSENIKHECGIAFLRLLRPLEYYLKTYGSSLYGIEKMALLLEKQHNRGQDGAGLSCLKLDTPPGQKYLHIAKSKSSSPIIDIFKQIYNDFKSIEKFNPQKLLDIEFLKKELNYAGEIFLGHLRYGTFGQNDIKYVHPIARINNWKTRSIVLAGNFNLTNADELFEKLISYGEHPTETSDTNTVLEKFGFFLDKENDSLWEEYSKIIDDKKEISRKIETDIDLISVIKKSTKYWDGGYVISGIIGNGDSFIIRDPNGIRPAFFYKNEEFVIAASERPAIQTAFNVPIEDIEEIEPGKVLIVKKNGDIQYEYFTEPSEKRSCSFERIYFSRGTDADIYCERKNLGKSLAPAILKSVNYDFENTVFSFIPNTAIVAFLGLREDLFKYLSEFKLKKTKALANNEITQKQFDAFFKIQPRVETIAVKDAKLRTFIMQDTERDELAAHVYDVTYGVIKPNIDTLVVLDDSIVRGTTLKQSILRILGRLKPKKIIVVSSAPQIRYPDCYGIDMTKLNEFIAFRAAIELLKETKRENIINEVYKKCKAQENKPKEEMINYVKEIYAPFNVEEISEKIAILLKPADINAKVEIIFQKIEDLHKSCPGNTGDWYFSGNYPTPGGNKVVNTSFINYIEGKNKRAYEI